MMKHYFLPRPMKLPISVLTLIVGFKACQGQSAEIQGLVTDGKMPLADVNIVVSSNNNGTKTDSLGRFSIAISKKDDLRFSHLGMASKKVRVKNFRDTLKVVMQPKVQELSEVTVKRKSKRRNQKALANDYEKDLNIIRTKFGYYDKARSAHSIFMVSGKDLPKGDLTFFDALKIIFPQLRITESKVFLGAKGNSSMKNEQEVLFELDGMVLTEAPAQLTISEIERIAIFRGVSFAMRYGTLGAGGVIVINTKR